MRDGLLNLAVRRLDRLSRGGVGGRRFVLLSTPRAEVVGDVGQPRLSEALTRLYPLSITYTKKTSRVFTMVRLAPA